MPKKGTPPAKRASVADRRRQAIEMRMAGVHPVTIGRTLKYGTWSDGPDGPGTVQVSNDGSLARMVRQDITRGLAERRQGLVEAADDMRQDMTERLERLRAGLWAEAVSGKNLGAAREARAIDAQLAQLWQLNAPIRHEHDVEVASRQVEEVVAELVQLVRTTAEGAPLLPALEA